MFELDVSEIGAHVSDADSFHLPGGVHVHLPNLGPIEVFGTQIWDTEA